MTKRTLLFVLLLLGVSTTATMAQLNCTSSTKLVCQIPVATLSTSTNSSQILGTSPATVFNTTIAAQLSQLPLASAASGVVLTLDKSLGFYVASDNLGPILTERAQTIGKHKLFLAFSYQRFRFNSIDGTSLDAVPFVFTSTAGSGNQSILYIQERDHIDFKLDQYVALATFGLNDRTDISLVMPFERVGLGVAAGIPDSSAPSAYQGSGNQFFVGPAPGYTRQGVVPFYQFVPGSASGLGDILVNAKRLFWKGEHTNFAAGLLVRFPTGDALNYLGSGAYGFNPYAILAYQTSRISPHMRLGYQFNTTTVLLPPKNPGGGNGSLPGGFQYDIGADAVLFKKVPTTLAGDFLGNYVVNSPILTPTVTNVPGYNYNFANLSPTAGSYNSAQLSIGVKVKPWKTLVLYGNVLFQVNNVGLRSNPVPLVGISYTFF